MFNTFLHFAICAYPFKLGPCIVNRPCIVNAVILSPLLHFVLFMPDIIFVKKVVLRNSYTFKTNKKEIIFFCTTNLF